ncbi:MAG: hypothetical protein JWN52_7419 [Actinomycetia bacterium]|nr:hypothetical protein [Actinomycetes bacterium]
MRMRKIGRLAMVSAAAVGLTLGSTAGAEASVAKPAKAVLKPFVFDRKHESHVYKGNGIIFTAQINLTRGPFAPGFPMPWSYRIGPALRAIATGPMACVATGHDGYHDSHSKPPIPVNYYWHSTVRKHVKHKVYDLYLTCKFPVNVGGNPGIATSKHHFKYKINP